ncbi:hypothetical protein ISF_05228 [Cordyceps fumosorosea ARSEF 2679]|uniref:Uncharacterized protein n=1 Tax=Cordyceps fumosorosea (strain ARSEF 2679) TaxID=1081104 RepID=A0A167V4L1_CORFA|nr:hypothetical protein ISF_05228 [Cordyceps fumosorosea ARSEF 2679]OAA62219.1 hypothetical protein ISF_05228 [Cordyceps fumosorosea ARSEF 2679]
MTENDIKVWGEAELTELEALHETLNTALRSELQQHEAALAMRPGGDGLTEPQPLVVDSWAFQKRLMTAALETGDLDSATGYHVILWDYLSGKFSNGEREEFYDLTEKMRGEEHKNYEDRCPKPSTSDIAKGCYLKVLYGRPMGFSRCSQQASWNAGPVARRRPWAYQKKLIEDEWDDLFMLYGQIEADVLAMKDNASLYSKVKRWFP